MDGIRAVRSSKINPSGEQLADAGFGADRIVGDRNSGIFLLEIDKPFLVNRVRESRSGSS